MTTIYIARHGQNEDNAEGILNGHRDRPLTELGIKQAHELADGILAQGFMFDAIYTSPLVRAAKTAEIIAERIGGPTPEILAPVIERDFGVMSGQLVADIERLCAPDILKTDLVTYFLNPEGGETFPTVLERASDALRDIHTKHPAGSVLVVTHGDLGKMMYASFYELPWQDILTKFHFGNCELLQLIDGGDHNKSHVIRVEQFNH